MVSEEIYRELSVKNEKKIVLLVMDGVGDLPVNGKTPLEVAKTPNLDALAKKSITGLTYSVSMGISPGSGPAHIPLFGYDPFKYDIGRGVLEALGIDFELGKKDIAARANFATIDKKGIITDRRAGRIHTEKNKKICAFLSSKIKTIEGVKVIIRSGKEHRFVVIFRGDSLFDCVTDTDPQQIGLRPKVSSSLDSNGQKTARIVNRFVEMALPLLKDYMPSNFVLLRGISRYPDIPSMEKLFKLVPAAIATYPMYKGLAKLVGMQILKTGSDITSEFKTLKENWSKFDFFFIHIKKTDSYGEDGSFDKKVSVIEEVDKHIPQILDLKPDCFVITGDHSTPCKMKSHSWHPNPFLLHSPFVRKDLAISFTELECAKGVLGRFGAVNAISLMLAHTLKLKKYGA
ncbi:MAG: 2,3-bisphosphoglycerate-independent phosphoglycerate mutase [Candidatus Cloacimonadota bacterium]|nr:MAG: 2,3-bisphosphoglycerate-independent phosphoglycerate mutase [Candidatus Cloacimonadota bacterium]